MQRDTRFLVIYMDATPTAYQQLYQQVAATGVEVLDSGIMLKQKGITIYLAQPNTRGCFGCKARNGLQRIVDYAEHHGTTIDVSAGMRTLTFPQGSQSVNLREHRIVLLDPRCPGEYGMQEALQAARTQGDPHYIDATRSLDWMMSHDRMNSNTWFRQGTCRALVPMLLRMCEVYKPESLMYVQDAITKKPVETVIKAK